MLLYDKDIAAISTPWDQKQKRQKDRSIRDVFEIEIPHGNDNGKWKGNK